MLKSPKLSRIVMVFVAPMLLLAADVASAAQRDARIEGHDSFQVQAGDASLRAPDPTALHATRLNRALWERSFERGINSRAALLSSPAQPPVEGQLKPGSYEAVVWPAFSNSFVDTSEPLVSYRKPGIGACLLAALAIFVLGIWRRRAGYHPIVPPRPMADMQALPNGAQ